jgi:hypothetical protein
MMILLLLFLQKQSLAFAVYLFGIGTLLISSQICVSRDTDRVLKGNDSRTGNP